MPTSATANIPPRWRLAEVAQTLPETEQPATDFVLEGDLPLMAARAALAEAEHGGDGHAIAEAHEALAHAREFDANSRAQSLLLGPGLQDLATGCPGQQLLGRLRMRLQLARALMCPADLMLLDEPTNHLDLDALVWLEAWLQRFEGTLVIISHDREFLDAITRVTVHLDGGKINRYGGNYSTFEAMLSERQTPQAGRLRAPARSAWRSCSASSTASRPRPARPSRRKAASRPWVAWKSSRRC